MGKVNRSNFVLYRKIEKVIADHLKSDSNKIMIINGARQVGKSFIIRHAGQKLFKNYIEINLMEDFSGEKNFANVRTVADFYFQISMIAGSKMGKKNDTLIFLDEIQAYPHLLTMLKFLKQDDKFTYIASGSLLGITLAETSSIPMGSIAITQMHALDFEEFLYANGFNGYAIETLRNKFLHRESLDETDHGRLLDLFKKYLLVGGLPDAVNSYIAEHNIFKVRAIQKEVHDYYMADASKYDAERKLKIRRIYEMIPSALGNKKKRIVIKDIDNIKGKTFAHYQDEFDYLINSGIALEAKAVSTPVFPLIASSGKNLLKLYLNDVGILTGILYQHNIRAVLDDEKSINLGTVYENATASELNAHGKKLFYYDNKKNGEVDFLIDDYDSLSSVPIEVKSGKDYSVHNALDKFLANPDYNVSKAFVLSSSREIRQSGKITYLPVYFVMFI